jgi:hypothetical protein
MFRIDELNQTWFFVQTFAHSPPIELMSATWPLFQPMLCNRLRERAWLPGSEIPTGKIPIGFSP